MTANPEQISDPSIETKKPATEAPKPTEAPPATPENPAVEPEKPLITADTAADLLKQAVVEPEPTTPPVPKIEIKPNALPQADLDQATAERIAAPATPVEPKVQVGPQTVEQAAMGAELKQVVSKTEATVPTPTESDTDKPPRGFNPSEQAPYWTSKVAQLKEQASKDESNELLQQQLKNAEKTMQQWVRADTERVISEEPATPEPTIPEATPAVTSAEVATPEQTQSAEKTPAEKLIEQKQAEQKKIQTEIDAILEDEQAKEANKELFADVEQRLSEALTAVGMNLKKAETTPTGYEIIITKKDEIGQTVPVFENELVAKHPDIEKIRREMIGALTQKFFAEHSNQDEIIVKPVAPEKGKSLWERARSAAASAKNGAMAGIKSVYNTVAGTAAELGRGVAGASEKVPQLLNKAMASADNKMMGVLERLDSAVETTADVAERTLKQLVASGLETWNASRRDAVQNELLASFESFNDLNSAIKQKTLERSAVVRFLRKSVDSESMTKRQREYVIEQEGILLKLMREMNKLSLDQEAAGKLKEEKVEKYRIIKIRHDELRASFAQPTKKRAVRPSSTLEAADAAAAA